MNKSDYDVLTREEVRRIIEADQNPKNRLMLVLAYSAGLRADEIQDLRSEDIDFDGNIIHIKASGRVKKERAVSLSKSILELLRPYIEIYRPSPWLFPGPDSVSKITGDAIENVFRNSMQKAGISRESGILILRRSISAHLHQSGAGADEIKKLLGQD
ncbi:MAG: tyrosine-type recombinase/integrase [Brevinematales bacterium]|jgi:integrase